MSKFSKIVLYIVACVVVFVILAKIYDKAYSRQANAFEWEKQVHVYFIDEAKAQESDCSVVTPVARTILNAETLGPGALEALLKGPNMEETSITTAINSGVFVKQFELKEGVAYVDFNSEFNQGVAGSCRVIAIRSQIEKTLLDLSDISSVVISVEGETDGILEP